MTKQQLQTLETELEKRGYRKWTRCLTSSESWSWVKTFAKEYDEDGEVVSGCQVAFRVWDYTAYNSRYNLNEEYAYGFDFGLLLSAQTAAWTSRRIGSRYATSTHLSVWRQTSTNLRENTLTIKKIRYELPNQRSNPQ